MDDWRICSLFSGIGGLELGLERAGLGSTSVQVEYEEHAQGILARHWPDARRFGDVREVTGADVGRAEVMCGGYPCQPFSKAGSRRGTEDERALWPEFARLIGEVGPEVVVLENVTGHLSLGFGEVLGDLAALGYDAEWDCIPAAAVGAPHQRDRLFCVAYPHGSRYLHGESCIFPAEARFPAQREPVAGGPLVAYAGGPGRAEHQGGAAHGGMDGGSRTMREGRPSGGQGLWSPEPDVGRVVDGFPGRVDRIKRLGNAVVPQVAEYVGGLIVKAIQRNAEVPKHG